MPATSPGAYASAVHWTIGDQTLTTISDGYFETDLSVVFPEFDNEEAARLQRTAHRPATPRITHNMYVVRGPWHAPVLIDAGMGDGWGPTMGHVPSALASIGVLPEEVGTVMLTHLHLDHSAGLINADGTPRFPNADVVMHAEEADYWLTGTPDKMPVDVPPWAEEITRFSVAKAVAPYRHSIRTFTGERELVPGITAVPLTGHTPGHSGYRVGTGERSVLTVGDIVHLPAVQGPRADATVVFDVDPAAAAKAREDLLDDAARNEYLIAGAHTEFPGVGRVSRQGDGYEITPELWVASLG
ncbi:MBL fold metallo-hydrolase [Amycolatopsis sp. FU40]|uniref:MBL fold metallo-hydrolase n=1 Tax=Amycolatopsis sp. FU40 TaxID=2914159 RepID=UPI001F4408B1|nr:MBL fold metallo-hydrolase [Amycolatopsis sp. FU40]UKD51155.1 MBL fold metallo-hydrolase [Amycolatopsis sp. FU40]